VVFNALPSYPQSHLNAAVWAGATQVLCASPNLEVQARTAMRHNATHCYTIDRMSWPAEARRTRIAS
jgi:long-chain acyl-CoA synthetase